MYFHSSILRDSVYSIARPFNLPIKIQMSFSTNNNHIPRDIYIIIVITEYTDTKRYG